MTPKKPDDKTKTRTKALSEITEAEQLYRETGDFRFVLLTMGHCRRETIPQWALDACRAYYERWELNHHTPITSRIWELPPISRDGKLLDRMAEYLLGRYNCADGEKVTKANVHAAATFAAKEDAEENEGEDALNPDIQRLTRAWHQELKMRPPSVPPDEAKALTYHPRIDRAFHRLKKSF